MRQMLRAGSKFRQRRAELASIVRSLPPMLASRRVRAPGEPLRLRFVYHELGAPTRYRVAHQVEQANLAGFHADAFSIDAADGLYDLSGCDVLFLHRLALAPPTLALCLAARRYGIPIVFDSDDLVWDQRERAYNYLDDHYTSEQVARLLWATRRTRALMGWADAFVCATPYLARLAAQAFSRPVYVNSNALSAEMVRSAERASAARSRGSKRAEVVVGYFCGSPRVHDEDVASIALALCQILRCYPAVRLRIYGELKLSGALAEPAYHAQIEWLPAVDWRQLPHEIAKVDINIAPLVDNPQRRAKSAIKYLEAALVGVPTVASRLDPYQHDIVDRQTGLLASTADEWTRSLGCLIESAELRRLIGAAARMNVLSQHTTAVRAHNLAAIVTEVVA